MSEPLTFANYSPSQHGLEGIYQIGATDQYPDGVAHDMAVAFNFDLTETPNVDNLGGLIGQIGPAKELQENIGRVQNVLGVEFDAVTIAQSWIARSGLLTPVEGLFDGVEPYNGSIDLAIITGGVRNWMDRRATRLIEYAEHVEVENVLLASGSREMKPGEGPDVEEGMTEADWMKTVLLPRLGSLGIDAKLLRVKSGIGDDVMEAAARKSQRMVPLSRSHVAVVSNAGNWPQNAGQYLRAAKKSVHSFNKDGDQFEVVSDSFPVGTGAEPTSTHQNPFTALGQIARNLQEFTRHAA